MECVWRKAKVCKANCVDCRGEGLEKKLSYPLNWKYSEIFILLNLHFIESSFYWIFILLTFCSWPNFYFTCKSRSRQLLSIQPIGTLLWVVLTLGKGSWTSGILTGKLIAETTHILKKTTGNIYIFFKMCLFFLFWPNVRRSVKLQMNSIAARFFSGVTLCNAIYSTAELPDIAIKRNFRDFE